MKVGLMSERNGECGRVGTGLGVLLELVRHLGLIAGCVRVKIIDLLCRCIELSLGVFESFLRRGQLCSKSGANDACGDV